MQNPCLADKPVEHSELLIPCAQLPCPTGPTGPTAHHCALKKAGHLESLEPGRKQTCQGSRQSTIVHLFSMLDGSLLASWNCPKMGTPQNPMVHNYIIFFHLQNPTFWTHPHVACSQPVTELQDSRAPHSQRLQYLDPRGTTLQTLTRTNAKPWPSIFI